MRSSLHDLFVQNHIPLVGPLPWQKRCWDQGIQEALFAESRDPFLEQIGRTIYRELDLDPFSIPEKVVLLPVTQAYSIYRTFLDKWAHTIYAQEKDPWGLILLALARQSWFLYVPPGMHISFSLPPIPHLIVFVGAGSRLALRSTATPCGGEGWVANRMDAMVEEGGVLLWEDTGAPSLPTFLSIRCHLKKKGIFRSVVFPEETQVRREDYHLSFQGEESEGHVSGLLHTEQSGMYQVRVLMEHEAPHTISRQNFKAAVGGTYQHRFEGKIYIHAEAQQVDAYQRHHALLLSPEASVHSYPNLEIFADDVKASHGATCGELDEEELFYLQSRGLSAASSRALLIAAFCQDIHMEREALYAVRNG